MYLSTSVLSENWSHSRSLEKEKESEEEKLVLRDEHDLMKCPIHQKTLQLTQDTSLYSLTTEG